MNFLDEGDELQATLQRLELQPTAEPMESVELLPDDQPLDKGNDLPAALERLELLASVEPLATAELLAEDELLHEGEDLNSLLGSASSSAPPLNSWQRLSCWPERKSLAKAMTCRRHWSASSSRPRRNSG